MVMKKTLLCLFALLAGLMVTACRGQSSTVAEDEDVLLFTTSAGLDAAGKSWQVPVHGWIFEREAGSWWRAAVSKGVLEMLELSQAEPESKILQHRLEMFLVDNERGKTLTVGLNARSYAIGPSEANGHFTGLVDIACRDLPSFPAASGLHSIQPAIKAADGRSFKGRVQLLPPQGVSVISDIDDTIKVSHVLDKSELLANTFLRPFQPIPDMAAVYQSWSGQGAAFHYVSASPWQLYPALSQFLDQTGFPPGAILLRYLRIKDRSFFDFMRTSMAYKTRTIEALIHQFPQRKFILIGDSGENDPAVYAAVARKYPANVLKIYIRLVLSDANHRSQAAEHFKDLPKDRWQLFQSGTQLQQMAVSW
jgi:phosphatidate phosphatase APP1